MTEHYRGFIEKCAQRGIDGRELYKEAFSLHPASWFSRAGKLAPAAAQEIAESTALPITRNIRKKINVPVNLLDDFADTPLTSFVHDGRIAKLNKEINLAKSNGLATPFVADPRIQKQQTRVNEASIAAAKKNITKTTRKRRAIIRDKEQKTFDTMQAAEKTRNIQHIKAQRGRIDADELAHRQSNHQTLSGADAARYREFDTKRQAMFKGVGVDNMDDFAGQSSAYRNAYRGETAAPTNWSIKGLLDDFTGANVAANKVTQQGNNSSIYDLLARQKGFNADKRFKKNYLENIRKKLGPQDEALYEQLSAQLRKNKLIGAADSFRKTTTRLAAGATAVAAPVGYNLLGGGRAGSPQQFNRNYATNRLEGQGSTTQRAQNLIQKYGLTNDYVQWVRDNPQSRVRYPALGYLQYKGLA